MCYWTQDERAIVDALLERRPDLSNCLEYIHKFHIALTECFDKKHCFFTCGNGGSHADALHIVGELCKSFERKRPLEDTFRASLAGLPFGADLAEYLEAGLPAITLGLNGALKTAIENDCPLPNIAFAQELNALMGPGDMLLAISTSGNARNCLMAMSVAKARGGIVATLTGPTGGQMAGFADIAIKAPGNSTKVIQEAHVAIWHTLCLLIEARYFPDLR
ncbi:MAG TPA: SIS domain-containing protein [Candidatus Hydrogenedentes bacterium]|nr:SIS domain-containing protein [Candidatus Hydrogenedentota bacterium]